MTAVANPMDLTGQRILVTGASSGIGKSTARLLSNLGAQLVLIARNQERLEHTLEGLNGSGHSCQVFDLSEVDNIPPLMKKIAQGGGPFSGVFHAAGVESIRALPLLKSAHIDEVFNPSFKAAVLLVRGFCQKGVRLEGTGSIVLMSSVTSVSGQNAMSVYSASKGAIDAAVRSFACDLAGLNVRINSIVSGAVDTEMHNRLTKYMSSEALDGYRQKHLLGFGQSEDIANAAAFLLSGAAKWITGTAMVVDGGYTCR